MTNVLKAFIVGSSWFTFILFFTGFYSLKTSYNINNMKKITHGIDPYFIYTISSPLYFGFQSIFAILISNYFNLHFRIGFLIISLISPFLISLFIKLNDVYFFTEERWVKQYIYLILYHMFTYNIIIANLYYLIK